MPKNQVKSRLCRYFGRQGVTEVTDFFQLLHVRARVCILIILFFSVISVTGEEKSVKKQVKSRPCGVTGLLQKLTRN